MTSRFSIALAGADHEGLTRHLIRPDGQEDICFALWRPSTGVHRMTAIVREVVLPRDGERTVHRNAAFTGEYALRAARQARDVGAGIALLHSHPGARTWQSCEDGSADAEAERKIANLAREMSDLPLVGLTLSTGSQSWSGRVWDRGRGAAVSRTDAEDVRVVDETLSVGYHPVLRPAPRSQPTQVRTVHSWGDDVQARVARLRVLVIGAGSVGQLVLEMLARTGVEVIGIMDFDTVEVINLDRLHAATRLDARLHVSKTELGHRVVTQAATALPFRAETYEASVCEPSGMRSALDFDVIFSCVDRPWPRHVLNTLAYTDLVPVIDGGVRLEPAPSGGLRNAYWRSHVAGPGRTCIRCLGQYNVVDVQLERDGSLDNPAYIAGLPQHSPLKVRQNVYATSLAAASALTNQFLSLVVAPSGFGDPGALRFDLRRHTVEHLEQTCSDHCGYQGGVGLGDARMDPTGAHDLSHRTIEAREAARRRMSIRLTRMVVSATNRIQDRLGRT